MDGTHSLETAARITECVWAHQMMALHQHHCFLEGLLLKPNMVRNGEKCPTPASIQQIAEATVRVFSRTIPPTIRGLFFLSGGMSEEDATLALNAINRVPMIRPWMLSFSYGRALQVTVIKVWNGKDENIATAQKALLARAKANGDAQQGKYGGGAGGVGATQSTFEANYKY
jgi:fructose-bisphosphate aldolase class I